GAAAPTPWRQAFKGGRRSPRGSPNVPDDTGGSPGSSSGWRWNQQRRGGVVRKRQDEESTCTILLSCPGRSAAPRPNSPLSFGSLSSRTLLRRYLHGIDARMVTDLDR